MPDLTSTPETQTFDKRTQKLLDDAAHAVMDQIPEIASIAFVVSWKLPINVGIVRGIMANRSGGAMRPWELVSLSQETLAVLSHMYQLLGSHLQAMSHEARSLEAALGQLHAEGTADAPDPS